MIKEFPNFPWQSELLVMLFWWADPSDRTSHDVNYVWLHPLYPDDFPLSDSRRHAGVETAAWPVSHDKIFCLLGLPLSLFSFSFSRLHKNSPPTSRYHTLPASYDTGLLRGLFSSSFYYYNQKSSVGFSISSSQQFKLHFCSAKSNRAFDGKLFLLLSE